MIPFSELKIAHNVVDIRVTQAGVFILAFGGQSELMNGKHLAHDMALACCRGNVTCLSLSPYTAVFFFRLLLLQSFLLIFPGESKHFILAVSLRAM